MHAVIATVDIPAGQFETARKMLRDEIVPRVSKAPGFVKGYWTIDGKQTHGHSMVVFDSKDHAEAAAQMARSGPIPAGVTMGSVDVCEVVANA
jgi:hypothetical protein